MALSNHEVSELFEEGLTREDVAILNDFGHDEQILSLLGVEHAARAQALIRACSPEMTKRIMLMLANKFLADAQAIHV